MYRYEALGTPLVYSDDLIPIPCLHTSLFLRGTTVSVPSPVKTDFFKPSLAPTKFRNTKGLRSFKISVSTVHRAKKLSFKISVSAVHRAKKLSSSPDLQHKVYQQVFKVLNSSQTITRKNSSKVYEI